MKNKCTQCKGLKYIEVKGAKPVQDSFIPCSKCFIKVEKKVTKTLTGRHYKQDDMKTCSS